MKNAACLILICLVGGFGRCADAQEFTLDVTTDRVAYQPGGRVQLTVEGKTSGEREVKGQLVVDIYCDAKKGITQNGSG